MAHYTTTLHSLMHPTDAFAYLADAEHFADWDPGVTRATRVAGNGPGLGAAYDLDVRSGPRTMTLRYETTDWDPPHRLILRAESRLLLSIDEIRVEPDAVGSRVTYDARLTLKGAAAIFDPLLALTFRRIGDRAAGGLRRALHAETVTR